MSRRSIWNDGFLCMFFDEEANNLNSSISDQEIKQVMFSFKPFKALGPNCLHAGFFFFFRNGVVLWRRIYARKS